MSKVSVPSLEGVSNKITFIDQASLSNITETSVSYINANLPVRSISFEVKLASESSDNITQYNKDGITVNDISTSYTIKDSSGIIFKSNSILAYNYDGTSYTPTETNSIATKKYVDDRLPFYYKDTQPKDITNDYIVRIHETTRV